jgi:NAD(P)H-hydrate epimerase
MKVLTAREMQLCDRLSTEEFGIPSFELMRAAAAAVAACARLQFPRARRIGILCGRGNNGGDGMVAAPLLATAGCEVSLLLLGSPNALKGDAARAWQELQGAARVSLHVIETAEDLEAHSGFLASDLLIDAVLGTGFRPPMNGLALAALAWVRRSHAPILAIDLPSGWLADSTAASLADESFPADAVVTFTAPKPAHLFGHLTRRWKDPVIVAPIGSPEAAIEQARGKEAELHWAGTALELARLPRPAAANKGNFGHVLVVGGCFGTAGGKAGAPAMAALAALRSGAGLVTAAVPAPALPTVASFAPELMTWPLAADEDGSIGFSSDSQATIAALVAGKTVLVLGPGLGQNPQSKRFAQALLAAAAIPAVLDADALNLLAADADWFAELCAQARAGRTLVLTPHPGEMARLCGTTIAAVQADRLGIARDFAQRSGMTLVLKGARTLIAHPDGAIAVNTSGNPGMAKGGSGDLLAGLMAGLLAQHPRESARAVEAAVCLHGLAADLAVRRLHERTLLATDCLIDFPKAFDYRNRGQKGYVWLQGQPTAPEEAAP